MRTFKCILCGEQFSQNIPGRFRYCEKHRHKDGSKHWYNYPSRLVKLCAAAKNRSKAANLIFDIDSNYLTKLWEQQNGRCALTGIEFDLTPPSKGQTVKPSAPSIDRIVPSAGYTKGNVRLVIYHMNVALSEYGTDQFELLARKFLASRGVF